MRKTIFFCVLVLLAFGVQAAEKADYVGAGACKACHEDKYASYAKSGHGNKENPGSPAAKYECETCHGAGSLHVEALGGRGVGGILPLGPKSSIPEEKRNAVCLDCHAKGKTAMWKGSAHESRGLSCTSCHSIHSGNPKNLVKPVVGEVCNQCHPQMKAELQKSSHHPIREGKMSCADCHNPHGTTADKLISANTVNEKCYECHTEKRGPFLWEHAPVTENCLNCHTPHGSSHEKLLVSKRPYLCQTCHSNSRHPGTLYAVTQEGQSVYKFSSNRLFARSCQNCHYQIHGSNHPSGKALGR